MRTRLVVMLGLFTMPQTALAQEWVKLPEAGLVRQNVDRITSQTLWDFIDLQSVKPAGPGKYQASLFNAYANNILDGSHNRIVIECASKTIKIVERVKIAPDGQKRAAETGSEAKPVNSYRWGGVYEGPNFVGGYACDRGAFATQAAGLRRFPGNFPYAQARAELTAGAKADVEAKARALFSKGFPEISVTRGTTRTSLASVTLEQCKVAFVLGNGTRIAVDPRAQIEMGHNPLNAVRDDRLIIPTSGAPMVLRRPNNFSTPSLSDLRDSLNWVGQYC